MKVINLMVILVGALAPSACGVYTNIHPNPDYHFAPTKSWNMKIYYDQEPQAEYFVIGKMDINPSNAFRKNEQERVWKQQAAKIGGQAIIYRSEVAEYRAQPGRVGVRISGRYQAEIIRWKEK
jgi:hypothetical protein